jgi:hypothetical protein
MNPDLNILGTLDFKTREVIFAALLLLLEDDRRFAETLTTEHQVLGKEIVEQLGQQLREDITYE